MKRLFLFSLLFLVVVCASAQSYNKLRFYTEYDYSRTAKSDLSCVLANSCRNNDGHSIDFGLKIASSRMFFNFGYQIALHEDYQNRLFYLENRYLYRWFTKYKLQEVNGMLSLGWRTSHWDLKLGLCNRYVAEIPLRLDGGEGTVFEPMNVVFDVEYNLFPENHPWNIGAGISNQREFIIERVTLFYYTMHGYYNLDKHWRITGEAGIHPCGVLNLSAQYNGYFVNVGITYDIDNPTYNYMIHKKNE